jgi:hypothetical protein
MKALPEDQQTAIQELIAALDESVNDEAENAIVDVMRKGELHAKLRAAEIRLKLHKGFLEKREVNLKGKLDVQFNDAQITDIIDYVKSEC